MENILSQEEINDLLEAIALGEVDIESEAEDEAAKHRDLNRLDLFRGQTSAKWRVANFDIILDAFARNNGITLANKFRQSASVKRVSLENEDFETFLQDLQEQAVIGIVRFEQLRSAGLLIFDYPLSFCLLEVMLGGTSDSGVSIPDRELTSIEVSVLKNVMQEVCQDWNKAFEPLEEIETTLVQAETNPRLVNIVTPDTEMLISRFSVKAGNIFGQMTLAIPFFALEPYKEKLKNRMFDIITVSGGQAWTQSVKQELYNVDVDLSAVFASFPLTIREILNLKNGDVIELESAEVRDQCIAIEEKPKFKVVTGVRNGKRTVRITERILPEGSSGGWSGQQ
ncbi:MAG: flagellar motor switch protein FliM [Desulfovermiculus sp.]